ncbi:MAG: HNH endonuclease [Chloroflexi bacterium]|nr:HNH endonuclease [Chloroflexota bacterium]
MKRQAISKTLRFQLFRRDGFQCLYCGRRPPDVVLHVDHAMPVAVGGDSGLANLVTCCSDCNAGKRDEIVVTPLEWEDSEVRRLESLQRLAELRAYQNLKAELDHELAGVVQALVSSWATALGDAWQPAPADVQYLLDDHDPDEIEKAFYLASRRSTGTAQDAWRYACAVLRNWRKQTTSPAQHRIGQDRTGQATTGHEP